MCTNTVSVGWDGRVFDCDFNQQLDLDLSLLGGGSGIDNGGEGICREGTQAERGRV